MTGTVFDIKEFTVHDGPGARITVFMKGCPLRCRWCHNPEGLSPAPQLLERKQLCGHCGLCRRGCDHPECQPFGRCLQVCPNGCLTIAGKEMTPGELAETLQEYAPMVQAMGGGVTFSGGEPLLQAEFVRAVAELLPGVHKAIQTSGYAPAETYRSTVAKFDYVLQDLKLADPVAHRQYTGVDNEKILRNIRWLQQSGKDYVLRIPLIPGITDTAENLSALAAIAESSPVELMPYNPLAGAKYPMVDMTYSLPELQPSGEDFTRYFQNAVLLG